MRLALLLAAATACTEAKYAAGYVGGAVVEYTACPAGLIDCGHVFMCAAPADNPLGHVEICIDDDDQPGQLDEIEALYGPCEPTPRHGGLCIYCPAERGCNAYLGCYGCPS